MSVSLDTLIDKAERHLPAEEGVWLFIIGDMIVFAVFFMVFTYYRSLDPQTFLESQAALNQNYGAFNTVLLLTSSWFIALALHAARKSALQVTLKLVAAAVCCGVGFVVVKYFEYGEKIQAGLVLTTNDFFMYYYVFTGVHLLHLLLGLALLIFLSFRIKAWAAAGACTEENLSLLEGGAAYWHMVDLLWIVLFPLIYLMK